MAAEPCYERIGKLIYGVQRLGGLDALRALETRPGVAPVLAASAGQLAERYDTFMKRMDEKAALDGPEVEEILRGTPELLAALAAGLRQGEGRSG